MECGKYPTPEMDYRSLELLQQVGMEMLYFDLCDFELILCYDTEEKELILCWKRRGDIVLLMLGKKGLILCC